MFQMCLKFSLKQITAYEISKDLTLQKMFYK